jgi:hypothetical protein
MDVLRADRGASSSHPKWIRIPSLDRVAPSSGIGALGGALTTLAFTAAHGIWISNIWFNSAPMVLAGAGCGAGIAWAYRSTAGGHTWPRWFAYILACVLPLVALGVVSIAVFEPRFSLAELIDNPDALGMLLGPALPLMVVGTIVGATLLWSVSGRKRAAFIPTLVTQALLMFLVGHNLAILGLVDLPADQLYRVVSFVGLTMLLGMGYALSVVALGWISTRSARVA